MLILLYCFYLIVRKDRLLSHIQYDKNYILDILSIFMLTYLLSARFIINAFIFLLLIELILSIYVNALLSMS